MRRIKNILCPTTLSDDSDLALGYAVALARTYDAELHVCYCATVPPWSDVAAGPAMPRLEVEGLFDQSLAPCRQSVSPRGRKGCAPLVCAQSCVPSVAVDFFPHRIFLPLM